MKFLHSHLRSTPSFARVRFFRFADKQIMKFQQKFIRRGDQIDTVNGQQQNTKHHLCLCWPNIPSYWTCLLPKPMHAAKSLIENFSFSFRSWISTDLHLNKYRFLAKKKISIKTLFTVGQRWKKSIIMIMKCVPVRRMSERWILQRHVGQWALVIDLPSSQMFNNFISNPIWSF